MPVQAIQETALLKSVKLFPQRVQIAESGYGIEFPNRQGKGDLGDVLTGKLLESSGYEELPSKVNKTQGIDGVYVRQNDEGRLTEVLIVENKVDGGILAEGQMTEEWINGNVEKMLVHSDERVRQTGQLVRENPSLVRKELWHHELRSGVTSVSSLDEEARKSLRQTETTIGTQVRKICEAGKTEFSCFPTTGKLTRILRSFFSRE